MPSRFIAGAVCPACGALDRIVVEGELDNRRRRCVDCDFRETLTSQSTAHDTDKPDAVDVVRFVTDPSRVGDLE